MGLSITLTAGEGLHAQVSVGSHSSMVRTLQLKQETLDLIPMALPAGLLM